MTSGEAVAIIHGLWMTSAAMRPLARRFAARGFQPDFFAYHSLRETASDAADRLAAWLREREIRFVVAHSLGGLVALRAAATMQPVGARLVLLGCPVQGSHVARAIARWPVGPALLGAASDALQAAEPAVPGAWEVGQIAGSRRLGLGLLAGGYREPGDGSVAVAETRADFLADHLTLAVSHSGMLLSRRVAEAAASFLREGRFSA